MTWRNLGGDDVLIPRDWARLQATLLSEASQHSRSELDQALFITGGMVRHLVQVVDELVVVVNSQQKTIRELKRTQVEDSQ